MTELFSGFVLWIITHTQTIGGLGIAFLLGAIAGMWIEFSGKEKGPHRADTR